MEDGGFVGGVFVGIALSLIVLTLIGGCADRNVWQPNEDECILAGYSVWTSTGPEEGGLCLGVIDGAWQAEPLEEVRARMEGQ